jgi:ABC-type transport system involved in multi-copper enzyme maturation permease subunit
MSEEIMSTNEATDIEVLRTGRLARLTQNPVALKELRSRMRGRRAFVVLGIYLSIMSGFIWLVYLSYYQAAQSAFGPEASQAGKTVFAAVLGIQAFLIVFVGPAFTAGAISGEKERQTYDLLRTTLLSAGALVRGKLLSALGYVFLLVFAAIPLMSLAFLLGGVAWEELLISQAVVGVAAVTYALVGLYASALMRSTLAASVTTYAMAIFLILGLPIAVGVGLAFIGIAGSSGSTPLWLQPFSFATAWYLIPTNLVATLIASELVLINESSLWYFTNVTNGYRIIFLSPWYLFIALYSLLSLLLYWGTVRRVRRIPRR